MNNLSKKVDLTSIQRETLYKKRLVDSWTKKITALNTDSQQSERLAESICICCWYVYSDRIGGAAITTQPCGICNSIQQYSSTATDVLCKTCAITHKLCKRCGADVNLENRIKFELPA